MPYVSKLNLCWQKWTSVYALLHYGYFDLCAVWTDRIFSDLSTAENILSQMCNQIIHWILDIRCMNFMPDFLLGVNKTVATQSLWALRYMHTINLCPVWLITFELDTSFVIVRAPFAAIIIYNSNLIHLRVRNFRRLPRTVGMPCERALILRVICLAATFFTSAH